MYKGRLELIHLLADQFKIKNRAYIERCAATVGIPISIRNTDYGAGYANSDYLDMMKRTNAQHRQSTIMDGFAPHDLRSGRADMWMRRVKSAVKSERGGLSCYLWDGSDVLFVRTEVLTINGWMIASFEPVPEPTLRPLEADGNQDCRHHLPDAHRSLRLMH